MYIERKQFLLIILLALNCLQGSAQEPILTLNAEQDVYNLIKNSALLIDTSSTLTFDQINTPEYQKKFVPSESEALSLGVIPAAVWIRISIQEVQITIPRQWILSLDYPLLDYVTVYQKDNSGAWKAQETGDMFPVGQREYLNRNFVFSLNQQKEGLTTFYLRCKTSGSMQVNLQLYSQKAFLATETRTEIAYGFFYGGLIIIMLYYFFLYFSLRDIAYLVYCIHIIASVIQQLAFSGHSNLFFFGQSPYWMNLHVPLSMALNSLTTVLFSIVFLKTKKFTPVLHKFLIGHLGLCSLHFVAIFFLPPATSIPIAGLLAMIGLTLVFSAGVLSYRKGNKSARFYILAWTVLIISGLVIALRLFGLLPNNAFTINCVKVALVLETLLLALALADKYNLYKLEKETTQRELLQLQENANKTLEEKVKTRTLELAETNEKLSNSLIIVEEERKKSDQLLLNILPAKTASELKEKGFSAPQKYELVTVLFTDFKNFTFLVESLPAEIIIKVLDICFLAFDEICEKHNIEKIKTIGDSYMAAGGLPIANTTNPKDVVNAALEMQEWMANWDQLGFAVNNQKWEIRIGIHSGPVMAGVVGKNKFAYDIWGDTVNIASRMESTGEVGKVCISKTTYELIYKDFHCVPRGKVIAKNVGEVEAYWVTNSLKNNNY